MSLRQMTGWGKAAAAEATPAESLNVERYLTLLVDGAALNTPEIQGAGYGEFRANVSKLALQLRDRLPEDDKLALIRAVVFEFEQYQKSSENVLRELTTAWRGLTATLFGDLMESLGAEAKSTAAAKLEEEIARLGSAEEIQVWSGHLQGFLHPVDAQGNAQGIASLRTANHTTTNDNAAGLRGGGSAVEHLRKIMERGGNGFVALFRLSCLDVISERFGAEAVEDCLMAVSAFLTAALHSDDAIFHWTDSSLLAILQGRPSEQILAAELQRIASQNRESSIRVAGRTIMLRTPLAFHLTPINNLRTAEDLYRISAQR